MKIAAAALVLASLAAFPAFAGSGVGASFGTRDPLACSSRREPLRGAPSPQLAATYMRCNSERVWMNDLYLYENLRLEIGAGQAYSISSVSRNSLPEIDPAYPVYPIRGAYQEYRCHDPRLGFVRAGRNCDRYDVRDGRGACYRTTFGDWSCVIMNPDLAPRPAAQGVPGPR